MKRSETLNQFLDRELTLSHGDDGYLEMLREKTAEYYATPKPKAKTLDEQDAEYRVLSGDFFSLSPALPLFDGASFEKIFMDAFYLTDDYLTEMMKVRYLKPTKITIDNPIFNIQNVDVGDMPHPENSSGRGQGRNPMAKNSITKQRK